MSRSLPALRDVFATLSTTHSIAALVVDLFGADALILGNEFNALPFIFHPSNATTLSLIFHLPDLDRAYSVEYRDLTDPITLPGCPPFLGTDLVDPMQDRTNDSYKWLLHVARGYMLAKGVLVNTFYELESQVIEALIEENLGTPPLYPIGPITQTDDSHLHNNDCLSWLDKQPEESVLYISFGSGGTLSCEQIFELAYGLEQSGQRFLWVLRSPNNEVANASFFGENVDKVDYKDPLSFLPNGFLERTNGLGLVVRSWAPQIEVLSHGSTGGFMSHCGWNSTLESVCKGVPFIAWPLYAEQRMNGRLLGDVWGVALRVKIGENGMVGRDEIGRIVRSLMEGVEGKRVRDRVRELKSKAALALREDGSSSKALEEVAIQWRKHVGTI
ncbi:hypothetical protein Syun_013347 [Stephania yunnanensis]|uniref:Uncharacterized protein n=1 Tax=Stephania yunnanensis TaxID=152371 RepID=A0AAP0PH89_9MAGN